MTISDRILDNPLSWAATVALLTFTAVCVVPTRDAIVAWGHAGKVLPERVADLQTAVELVPGQLLSHPTIANLAPAILAEVRHQGDAIREGAFAQIATARVEILGPDGHFKSIQDAVLARVDGLSARADAQLTGIRADLQPVLANSAALVKDAQDSWDANYNDVQAIIGSATVAVTQAAQVEMTFNEQFPRMVRTFEETNGNIAAITKNVDSMTAALDRKYFNPPKRKFWARVGNGIKDTLFLVAGFARVAK